MQQLRVVYSPLTDGAVDITGTRELALIVHYVDLDNEVVREFT